MKLRKLILLPLLIFVLFGITACKETKAPIEVKFATSGIFRGAVVIASLVDEVTIVARRVKMTHLNV